MPDIQTEITPITAQVDGNTVNAKRLTVVSVIPGTLEEVWRLFQRVDTMTNAARGMMGFKAVSPAPHPELWPVGQEVVMKTYLLQVLPMGEHRIEFVEWDDERHLARTQERGGATQMWNHTIRMTAIGPTETRVVDQIDIYAGRMTGLIVWFARRFYKHRRGRWHLGLEGW